MDKKCEYDRYDHVDTTLSGRTTVTRYIGTDIHMAEVKELRLYDVYKELLELKEHVSKLEEEIENISKGIDKEVQ